MFSMLPNLQRCTLLTILFLGFITATAQTGTFTLKGKVTDATDKSPIAGASVRLASLRDSSVITGTATNEDGTFELKPLRRGGYTITISYIGYSNYTGRVVVLQDTTLPTISLSRNETMLKDVTVVTQQVRVTQREDTTEMNASAYKTAKDASAEELVTKMPGVVKEGGTIKVQGEELRRVTVDGKEFFGEDASLALRNLPSEMIDRVQVFDRLGDQAMFSGFNDGSSQKTMNIVTKKGMNRGVFGNVYAGYGYLNDSRYSAGASINWFDGNRRLTFVGMSNNVNIQNFSLQDIAGLTGSQGGRGGGMRGGFGGMRGGRPMDGNTSNFLVGQQGGIAATQAAGLNFTDIWGKKRNFRITASYFVNYTDNNNENRLNRQFFNTGEIAATYSETNLSSSQNLNQRLNMRLEYIIDSTKALIVSPKFTSQHTQQQNQITGQNQKGDALLGTTNSRFNSANNAYNTSMDVLYQQRLRKAGRTFSVSVTPGLNIRNGKTNLLANNSSDTVTNVINQQGQTGSFNYSLSGNLSYTEPVGAYGNIQFTYQPSYNNNSSEKTTYNADSLQAYTLLDSILTNEFDNEYMVHRGGFNYRYNYKKVNIMFGANMQYALLTGEQQFPINFAVNRGFHNVLPTAMMNYKFSDSSNIRLFYRTFTNAPSLEQLQPVIDNSNPLLLTAGNTGLQQTYGHFAMVRYGWSSAAKAMSFFLFSSVNYTQNYIANATYIATADTLLQGDVLLQRGSQLTTPVNLQGNLRTNLFVTYGMPLKFIKSNLNLNAGINYNRLPGLVNLQKNYSNNVNFSGGLTVGSNISEKVDFTISYFGNYNIVRNTLQINANNNFFTHNASVRFNWQFWKGFVFNTTLNNTLYTGISQSFNQNFFLWNASLGYKFLKDKNLEVRFGVNDLLNQNTGVSRNITDTYIEDQQNLMLQRYWLLTVTYNIRHFFAAKK